MKTKTKTVPAEALTFTASLFKLESNGEEATSAKVRLVARSPGVTVSMWWGRAVHDLSGVRHKARIPFDYCHDPRELVGYGNKFEVEEKEGLVVEGALVPQKTHQRTEEIIDNMDAGVPYEASIYFGGENIEIEEIDAGEKAEVNGKKFDGPLTIFRSWPLRGVAICPYGADDRTSAKMNAEQEVTVKLIEGKEEMTEVIKTKMTDKEKKPVEGEGASKAEGDEAGKEKPAESTDAGTPKPEGEEKKGVEGEGDGKPASESEKKAEGEQSASDEGRGEFKAFVKAFGHEAAAKYYEAGKSMEDAKSEHIAQLSAENEKLRKASKTGESGEGANPAEFDESGTEADTTAISAADHAVAEQTGVSAEDIAKRRAVKAAKRSK